MLARNTHNRNIKKSNLQKVTRALANGEWQVNGEATKIASDGKILDGQHRLMAVVQTGVPMKTLLIQGLPNETQETMDTGSPRSAADVLRLRNEDNAVIPAAIAKKVRLADVYGIRAAVSNSYVVTTAEIVRTVEEHTAMSDASAPAAMHVTARRLRFKPGPTARNTREASIPATMPVHVIPNEWGSATVFVSVDTEEDYVPEDALDGRDFIPA